MVAILDSDKRLNAGTVNIRKLKIMFSYWTNTLKDAFCCLNSKVDHILYFYISVET